MRCYLIRHGQDDESVRGGWADTSLSDIGISQVKILAFNLLNVSDINVGYIYSSDLMRTKQTAEILQSYLNCPIIYLSCFREVNNGLLAGMKNDEALVKYPGLFWSTLNWDQCYPEGESPKDFFHRICSAWYGFKEHIRDSEQDIILVTHGGVLNVIQCLEQGVAYSNCSNPFPVGYAGVVMVDIK